MSLRSTIVIIFIYLICENVYGHRTSNVNNNLFDLQLYEDVLDDDLCDEQLSYLSSNDTFLLFRFLDAGLRIPSGVLQGSVAHFGNYYQCLDINEEISNMQIEGKYCMLSLPVDDDEDLKVFGIKNVNRDTLNKIKYAQRNLMTLKKSFVAQEDYPRSDIVNGLGELGLKYTLAVCVPKPCTVQKALSILLPFNINDFLNYEEVYCRLPNDKQWVPGVYIGIIIFTFFILLTLLSTCYDINHTLIMKKDSKKANPYFKIFSAYTNTKRLLTFTSNPGALECIDGIRALATMWVVVGHTFVVIAVVIPLTNPLYVLEWTQSFKALWITSGPITVDTFFLISGLLVVYTTAGKLSSSKFVKSIHMFYLQRYLRLMPIVATGILLEVSFSAFIVDGPYFETVAQRVANCRNNWWKAILFVQNYAENTIQTQCLGHLWYLDVDTQLYFLSPLILFWVFRSKKSAWLALTTGLLISLASATTFNFLMNFSGGTLVPSRPEEDGLFYSSHYYINTLTRASPFFVGMLFGYVMHKCRDKKVYMSKIAVAILWLCSWGLMTSIMYYNYPLMQNDWDNQLVDNIMNSFMRAGWALGLSWIIFACTHGYGGPVNWFLCLKLWKLPARLSFSIYVLHYPIMFITYSTVAQPWTFSATACIYHFLADYSLSFIISFIITLLIDAPFTIIVKLAFGGGYKKPNKLKTETVHDVSEDNKQEIDDITKGRSDYTEEVINNDKSADEREYDDNWMPGDTKEDVNMSADKKE